MKIKYATIAVENLEESIKFYKDIMGLEIDSQLKPFPGETIIFMKGEGEAMIELIEAKENPQDPLGELPKPGLMAVGIEVEDIDAKVEEFKSKGAKTQGPIKIPIGKLAFLEDPNGVRIALIQHQ